MIDHVQWWLNAEKGRPRMILRDPVDRVVRWVALSLIAAAQTAGEKLTSLSRELRDGDAGADDALHDFRVAVRGLRSWLRAFRPLLLADVSRKQRRRISDVFDATRPTRDAAVHLEWLQKERSVLSARQRVGQAWLSERLVSQRGKGAAGALAAAADLESMIPKLTRRLSYYRAPVTELERTTRFGSVLAESVRTQSEKLRRQLADVHDFTDVRTAHRARISAKNLRYVIEPVAKLVGDGDEIIETLKTLQDSLGDLHDVHVFAGELVAATEKAAAARVRPGLVGIARHLHERGIQSYANLERDWLNDAGASFFERVRDFAATLEQRAWLGTEIEHKYLVTRLPTVAVGAASVEIEQGYLPGEKLVERIRHVTLPDGAEKWFRTVKAGDGLERVELEEEADVNLARVMWGLTNGRRLRKRRYSICESDSLTWEVDEFLDRKLVLAEIEVPTPDTRFEVPVWLQEVMVREVTDEPDYSNARLAQSPVDSPTM